MTQGISIIKINGTNISSGSTNASCWLESVDLELGDAELYVDTIKAELRDLGETTAVIKLGWKCRREDQIQWLDAIPLCDFDPIAWRRFTGRYIRIRLEDLTPSSLWKFSALELFGQKAGGRL